jgi:tetratricopeptide (TPR) repeat protein
MAPEEQKDAGADRTRRRLESWKEIAAYLGRDVRTAQRWERRDQLPVHRLRHTKRGSVFAYPSELDAWRESRDPAVRTIDSVSVSAPPTGMWAAVLGVIAACALFVLGLAWRPTEPASVVMTRPVAPDTYEKYLKGLFRLERGGRTNVEESVQYFEATVAADRNFAPAYVQLAAAYEELGATMTGARPVADVQSKVIAVAKKALALDPRLAAAHSSLASAYQQEWRWKEAERGYRTALELDPGDPVTHARLGTLLMWLGRTDDGLEHARRARELDPLNVKRTIRLGWLLYHARRYDEAIREFQTVLDTEPNQTALWFLGFALIDSSRAEEGVRALERSVADSGRNPATLGLLARAYAGAGRRADALSLVDELKQRERETYVPPAPFVHAYVGLGDRENAFASLERAYREKSHIMQFLKTHPLYDSLRDDSRFADLVRRVGLD